MTDLFDLVESHETESLVNLAADYRHFCEIVAESEFGQQLRFALQAPEGAEHVESRIHHLVEQEFDHTYENPADAALAIYLHALYAAWEDRAILMAEVVLEAGQCWWAPLIAKRIRRAIPRFTRIGNPDDKSLTTSAQVLVLPYLRGPPKESYAFKVMHRETVNGHRESGDRSSVDGFVLLGA